MNIDFNRFPRARVYLRVSTNTPYLAIPGDEDKFVLGEMSDVQKGAPILLDLRVETLDVFVKRLGPVIEIRRGPLVATHLVLNVFNASKDRYPYANVDAVAVADTDVWTLDGDCLEYVYDAEKERFQHRDRYGIARVTTTTGFPALALRGYRLVDPFPVDPTTGISYIQHR